MTENCECKANEQECTCDNLCACGVAYGPDVTWGKVDKGIVCSLFWEVYFRDCMKGPDEVLVQHSKVEVSEEKVESDGVYVVTFTLDETLKEQYPSALVIIDGKWYDLAKLESPVELNVAANHRISIVWSPEILVETFLLAKKPL